MTTRIALEQSLAWLRDVVIPGYEQSQLPISWKQDSIRRCQQQIADIEWRLETDPPRDVPNRDEKKPYKDRVIVPRRNRPVKRNGETAIPVRLDNDIRAEIEAQDNGE